ncbi:MAG: 50S ribosomal protein L22 [Candidatus Omnitrophota bacterium]
MVSRAVAKFVRISPRKTRLVLDLVRNKDINSALSTLMSLRQRAAGVVTKVLKSAIANAEVKGIKEGLFISKITADGGPMWKRFRAAPMGRATRIRKRTTHITIELDSLMKNLQPAVKSKIKKKERVIKRQGSKSRPAKAGK